MTYKVLTLDNIPLSRPINSRFEKTTDGRNLDRYTRHDREYIQTHSGQTIKCVKVDRLSELETDKELSKQFIKSTLIIVDESQFIPDLYEFVVKYNDHKSFIISSLDGDYNQKPFGQVLQLIPEADYVEKLKALCEICCDGTEAIFTVATKQLSGQVQIENVGGNTYMSVCRKHRRNIRKKQEKANNGLRLVSEETKEKSNNGMGDRKVSGEDL